MVPSGETPLMIAATSQTGKKEVFSFGEKKGKTIIVQMLLESGADAEARDGQGFTALLWAAREVASLHALLGSTHK
jgi:ankyrin repeat protein